MKTQLNEVRQLQKVAGLIKEESNLTINQLVKQLNKIANSKGFYAVDKSADQKPKKGASGVNNLVRWEDEEGGFVELYYNAPYGSDITVDDLEINFAGDSASGNDPATLWLDPETWDQEFDQSEEGSGYDNEEDNF